MPIKGTCATTDFPSDAGCDILKHFYAVKDAAIVSRIRAAHGIIFCKTNTPPFATSWLTANKNSGLCVNPYPLEGSKFVLSSGGSSGGSAVAVATNVAPVAVSEDTGGSTRHPASNCGLFGYDPPRSKHPNEGNPGSELRVASCELRV